MNASEIRAEAVRYWGEIPDGLWARLTRAERQVFTGATDSNGLEAVKALAKQLGITPAPKAVPKPAPRAQPIARAYAASPPRSTDPDVIAAYRRRAAAGCTGDSLLVRRATTLDEVDAAVRQVRLAGAYSDERVEAYDRVHMFDHREPTVADMDPKIARAMGLLPHEQERVPCVHYPSAPAKPKLDPSLTLGELLSLNK